MQFELILIIVHALCWAVWFGAGINAPGDILRTLPMDHPHLDELLGRLKVLLVVWIAAANTTLWSGVVLAVVKFGWRDIPPGIFVKLGLTALTFVIGIGLLKPSLKRFMTALSEKDAQQIESNGLRFRRCVMFEKAIILVVVILTFTGKALFATL